MNSCAAQQRISCNNTTCEIQDARITNRPEGRGARYKGVCLGLGVYGVRGPFSQIFLFFFFEETTTKTFFFSENN